VKAYPLVERPPFIWIWMGDPAAADTKLIAPDLDFFADPAWTTAVHGYLALKCNYIAMHENLLDLTHFPFLHGEKVGSLEFAKAPFTVEIAGDRVAITRKMTAGTLARERALQLGIDPVHRVDQTSEGVFASPALHVAHSVIEDRDAGATVHKRFSAEIVHALTPASQTETHYFWVGARNYAVADEAMNTATHALLSETFAEDLDAMEWIEGIQSREVRPEFREISVRGDKAGLLMRTIIARLAGQAH
jgi:vanillate O-demethylase monooxygenase subunit